MYKKYYIIIWFVAALLGLGGCKYFNRKSTAKIAVARVGDKVLYEEDFADIFSTVQSPEDSLKLRQNYIEKWVRDEVLFLNALNNLTDSLKNKQEQLDLYYRSLIRYEYEKGLINQRLDTAVSDKEIAEYYNQFTESFILKRKLCKTLFLVLPNDLPKKDATIQWMKTETPENIDSLQKYCLRYGVKFNLNSNKWFYLDDLYNETQMPMTFQLTNSESPVVYNDSLKMVVFKVNELRAPGDPLPLQIAAPTIRTIIKNKSKVGFIKRMEGDVYQQAERKGIFEIYK
ncbi:hypothetical protein GC194_11465 [bacterium]|nr:hypothetical protein [bacterium]